MIAKGLKSYIRCVWFWPLPVFADFGQPGWVFALVYFALILNLRARAPGAAEIEKSLREQITLWANIMIIALLTDYTASFSPLIFWTEPKLVRIDPLSTFTAEEQITITWLDRLKQLGIEKQMPMTFRGKVLDAGGRPIKHANITYGPFDTYLSPSRMIQTQTDEKGEFYISFIWGTHLEIHISSEGFWAFQETFDSIDYRSSHFLVPDEENAITLETQSKLPTMFADELFVWRGYLPGAEKCFISHLTGKATATASPESICVIREKMNVGGMENPVSSFRVTGTDGIKVKTKDAYVESVAGFPILAGLIDITVNFQTKEGTYGSINLWGVVSEKYGEHLGYTITYNPSGNSSLTPFPKTHILNPVERINSPNGEPVPAFCGTWNCKVPPFDIDQIQIAPLGNYFSLYGDQQIRYDSITNGIEFMDRRSNQWSILGEQRQYWIQISPNQIVIPQGSSGSWVICSFDPKTDKLTASPEDSKGYADYITEIWRSQ